MGITVFLDGFTEEEVRELNIRRAYALLGITEDDIRRHEEERAAEELRNKIAAEQDRAEYEAQWRQEYEEFKQRIRDAKLGKNDLKPNNHWLKIRRFCFRLTQEIFDLVEV